MKVWRRISKAFSHVEMCFMYMTWLILYQKKRGRMAGRNASLYVQNTCRSQENTKKLTEKEITLFSEGSTLYGSAAIRPDRYAGRTVLFDSASEV